MGYFPIDTNTISPFMTILWCFYPVALLVGLELFLRAANDEDDDDDGDGLMTPVYQQQGYQQGAGA